jgi:hypothetical protein
MPRLSLRFSLRTLLFAIVVFGVGLGLAVSWWTRPYALHGSYPNGQRAWEQWERRTLALKLQHLSTTRWYADGNLAYECHDPYSANCSQTYYSPDGSTVDDPGEWSAKYLRLIQPVPEDDPDSRRPYKQFLWWWNGWNYAGTGYHVIDRIIDRLHLRPRDGANQAVQPSGVAAAR